MHSLHLLHLDIVYTDNYFSLLLVDVYNFSKRFRSHRKKYNLKFLHDIFQDYFANVSRSRKLQL